VDSRHIQTTVTQQTFDSFGGSLGNNVQISVRSQASFDDLRCPIGGNSATQFQSSTRELLGIAAPGKAKEVVHFVELVPRHRSRSCQMGRERSSALWL
jgi:hypothetical protein